MSAISSTYSSGEMRVEADVTRDEVWIDLHLGQVNEVQGTTPVRAEGRLHVREAEKYHALLGQRIKQARALHDRRVARGEE